MKCSVFIATSADGFIARDNGSVDWLDAAQVGKEPVDMGFNDFIESVDCMVMGRNCMEMIASMQLTPEQWPYRNMRIIVLSKTLQELPENVQSKMELYAGELPELIARLEEDGLQHAYIDGGQTIQSFLNLQLIQQMHIFRAPVLIGSGKPLFGKTHHDIRLNEVSSEAYNNGFVRISSSVEYQPPG